jgi:iron complex outermembrane receptor protein
MHLKKFFICLILFIILFNNTVFSQLNYNIKGRIIDLHDSSPLPGVNVLLVELKYGAATNEEGIFIFRNIPEGNYTLRASFIGHQTVIKKISVPVKEDIEIGMTETTIDLKEITVTGNPLESDPKNIAQTTLILSKLDLQVKRKATLGEILNFQPGISMRSNGTATSYPVIRGFSNNRILVLEDGLRIGDLSNASDDHAISGDGSVPEKIEVLRGPASLLYGSNAIGGVVNIITDIIPHSVPQYFDGFLNASVSSVNAGYLGSGHLNYGIDKFSFHGNYFARKGLDYKIPGDSKVINSDFKTNGYQIGTAFHPEWGIAGLSYSQHNSEYGIPVSPDAVEGPVYLDMQKKQFRFLNELSSIKSFVRSMSLKAAYQDYKHKEISRATGEVGTNFGLKTFSGDLSFKHEPVLDKLTGVFGFWGMKQEYTVEGEEAFTPNADYLSLAGYFFEQVNPEPLHIQFGARYEMNKTDIPSAVLSDSLLNEFKKTYNSFSGSIGLVYNLSEHLSLYGNIAHAFRAPTVEELSSFAVHEATLSFDIGSRNLKQENNIGFDLGLRLPGEKYFAEVNVYYNSIKNFIYRNNTGLFYSEEGGDDSFHGFNDSTGIPVFVYSQADAFIYGLEAKARYEFLRGLSTTVIFDFVRGENKSDKTNLPQMPPMRFSIEQRYATDYYWAGFQWKIADKQDKVAPNEIPTPGYGIVDLYAGVKFLTNGFAHIIDFKVENLFNQPYRDHLSAIKEFTFMPGRNFELGYKFIF